MPFSRYTHPLRRVMLWLLIVVLALVCATLPAALRWELVRLFSTDITETSTITSDRGRFYLRVWNGRVWSKDALNLSISDASPASFTAATAPNQPPPRTLRDGLVNALPHRAWLDMIVEAQPQANDFFNLQAWGFPCRALAGGFANGTKRRMDWYWDFDLRGKSFTIPTRPIWSGIVINTAFYVMLILAIVWLARTLWHRFLHWRAARVRGLCPHCRYDRAGLDAAAPCPECGTSANAPS